jgi:4-amino-4-deoxy-L-arabinose transferase-like glycosyltransferase
MKFADIFSSMRKRIRPELAGNSGAKILGWVALAGMAGLAAVLRFTNLTALGYANHYYAAAVLSMTKSWHNFFFLAAEPGGSVSLDKPPLGLWFQAVSASIFGINSFGLLFPQLLAGFLSVLLVYYLVRRSYGTKAGLLAGLMMAIMPVAVAVDRNNTMDSTLIFTLLLAAWAFIKATETSRLRFLLAGATLVGLGFNIKMLEAFLPLPAFFLLYFTGSAESVKRKLIKLAAATVLIGLVSLSWMTVVDLTPSNQRPYVDNSGNNSVYSLVVNYNGIERVLGAGSNLKLGRKGSPFPGTGTPGFFRLVAAPLNKEASWLLPMGLVGLLGLLFSSRLKWPLTFSHQALILWGGWLAAGGIFISVGRFIHEYYLSLLAPPLAILSAVGLMYLWKLREKHFWLALGLLAAAIGGSLVFQVRIAQYFMKDVSWLPVLYILYSLGVVMMVTGAIYSAQLKKISNPGLSEIPAQQIHTRHPQRDEWIGAFGMICLAGVLLLSPGIWAGLTTIHPSANQALPAAYDEHSNGPGKLSGLLVDPTVLDYLQENTKNDTYLMAVPSSMQGADYVLATGRPVLYVGGFSGGDQAVSSDQLGEMVSAGELRYIYWGAGYKGSLKGTQGVSAWVSSTCKLVPGFDTKSYLSSIPDGTLIYQFSNTLSDTFGYLYPLHLYDCKN